MLNSWPLAKDLQVLVEIVHSGSLVLHGDAWANACICHQADPNRENTLATTLLNRSAPRRGALKWPALLQTVAGNPHPISATGR